MAQRQDEIDASGLADDDLIEDGDESAAPDEEVDADAIRDDIERTRAEMSVTIDAIQERLNPTTIKEQVMDEVREQFQEAKDTVRAATIGKVEHMVQTAGD